MKLALAPIIFYLATMLWTCNPSQHGNFMKWNGVTTYTNGQSCNCQYILYRSLDNKTFSPYATLALSSVTYGDTNIVSGTTYWYKVTAKDKVSGKESTASNILVLVAK